MPADYVEVMRQFRSGGPQAAAIIERRAVSSNPLRVNRNYRKAKSLSRDLTRYYEECTVSKTAKKLTGQHRKSYCAGVAWKRLKMAGRYPDYPGFAKSSESKETSMAARKSRKRSKATGARKRDASGRFLKRKKATAKASPRRAKRRTTRSASKKRAPVRRRKVAVTKAPRRRATRRRSTVSPEETMKRKSPRRRRRVAAAVAVAKPRKVRRRKAAVVRTPAQKRRRAKARARKRAPIARALVGWTTSRGKRRILPVKVSKRRRPHTTKVRLHRKSKGRSVTRVVYVNESAPRRRRAKARRRTAKRNPVRRSRRRSSRRRSYARETMMLNPIGGYGLENPLSNGEAFAAVVSGGVGYFLNDLLDRWLAHKGATTESGIVDQRYQLAELSGQPNMKRIGAQLVLPLAALFGAPMVRNPMGRSILQGAGIGAGVHLIGQLINTYVMGKFLKDKQFGVDYYPDVLASNSIVGTVAGLPVGVGAYTSTQLMGGRTFIPSQGPVSLQALQPAASAPTQSSRVVPAGSSAVVTSPSGQTSVVSSSAPGQPASLNVAYGGYPYQPQAAPLSQVFANPPGFVTNYIPDGPMASPSVHPIEGPITGQPCMPCSAETSNAAFRNAYAAARDEVGSCGVGRIGGINPSMSFPE